MELLGDPQSLLRSFRKSVEAADFYQGSLKKLSRTAREASRSQAESAKVAVEGNRYIARSMQTLAVDAKASAEKIGAAAVKRDARIRQEIIAYRELAAAAVKSSREQITYTNLADRAEAKLSRQISVSAAEQTHLARSSHASNLRLRESTRGAIAGSGAFQAMGRSIAFASLYFLSFAATGDLIRSAVGAAADLSQQIARSRTVFQGSAGAVIAWSKTLNPVLGLTRAEALLTATTIGKMFTGTGVAAKKAAGLSEQVTKMAANLAAFAHMPITLTLKAIQGGLAGMPRPLRQFGVFLSQSRIAAEALSLGLVHANVSMGKVADAQNKIAIAGARLAAANKNYGRSSVQSVVATNQLHSAQRALATALGGNLPKLNAQQKLLASLSLIGKDTAAVQGFAAKTSHTWAGETRTLHAEMGNLKEVIGTELMPTFLHYLTSLTGFLGKSQNQERIVHSVTAAVQGFAKAISAAAKLVHALVFLLTPLTRALGGVYSTLKVGVAAWLLYKAAVKASTVALEANAAAQVGNAATMEATTAGAAGLRGGILLLRGAFGKAGLAGAVIFAGYELSTFIRKIPGWDSTLHSFGEHLYDVTRMGGNSKFNPFSDPTAKFKGTTNDLQTAAIKGIRQATQMLRRGISEAQIAAVIKVRFHLSDKDVAIFLSQAQKRLSVLLHPGAVTTGPVQTTADPRKPKADWTKVFSLPHRFDLEQAKAEASGSISAVRAAAQHAKAYLLKIIPTLSGQELVDAYTLLGQAKDTLRGTLTTVKLSKVFTLPFKLQLEEAKAQASGSSKAIKAAARDTRAAILKAIPNLKGEALLSAYGLLAQANATLTTKVKEAAQKALVLPFAIQLEQAKGDATGNKALVKKAAREARAWILKLIPTLKGEKLLEAYGILGQANSALAGTVKKTADKAAQARDALRAQLGDLFTGPVINPTEQQRRQALGAPGFDPQSLTKDLLGQTKIFSQFQSDLSLLGKRGAPKELLKELNAQGPSALPQVEALAKASKTTLGAYFKAFRAREALVAKVANVQMNAAKVTVRGARVEVHGTSSQASRPIIVHTKVELDGKTIAKVVSKHQDRDKGKTAVQTSGRYAGR